MSSFKVGDRVQIIGCSNPDNRAAIGTETTITELPLWWADWYEVDLLHPTIGGRYYVHVTHLKPIYDGHEKTSWSECAWQPNSVRA